LRERPNGAHTRVTQRIAHEKVESQRQQLEEQERQIAMLRERIAVLEGEDHGRADGRVKQGGTSVDDFSIKVSAPFPSMAARSAMSDLEI
jgi:hypothetical protein